MAEPFDPAEIQAKIDKYRKMIPLLDEITVRRVKSLVEDLEQILNRLREESDRL